MDEHKRPVGLGRFLIPLLVLAYPLLKAAGDPNIDIVTYRAVGNISGRQTVGDASIPAYPVPDGTGALGR